MGAITIDDTPVRTSTGARAIVRRAWKSRVTMTAFYLATLAGLLFVAGARLDGLEAQSNDDRSVEEARPQVALIDVVEKD